MQCFFLVLLQIIQFEKQIFESKKFRYFLLTDIISNTLKTKQKLKILIRKFKIPADFFLFLVLSS